jgi:hypothetical protein
VGNKLKNEVLSPTLLFSVVNIIRMGTRIHTTQKSFQGPCPICKSDLMMFQAKTIGYFVIIFQRVLSQSEGFTGRPEV